MLRPSDLWDEAADDLIDAAQVAAASAEHFDRLGSGDRATWYRGAAAGLTAQSTHYRKKARILRLHEDAMDRITDDATTVRYVWLRERWWMRWARWALRL